jgi:hypothetical protein
VPYSLFKLFLVHKISVYNYIYENGKKKWEKKKRREFLLAGPGGEILAHPGASARASAAGGPSARETAGDGTMARAHTSAREGGLTAWSIDGGGERSSRARPPVQSRGGSSPWVRFCGGGAVARHGRG